MKPVRWGVLGVSKHFIYRVLTPLQKIPDAELIGISSRNPERAKNIAKRYCIPNAYSSYEELLRDSSVEAVYIPLPNHLHLTWIKKAADAGKHILCEKPLALNAREASEAMAYAREKGVMLMEAFMYRFHPLWKRAREIIQVGEIGQINAIHAIFTFHTTDPTNIRNSLEKGGGSLLDIGCYAVSMARLILNLEPKRVISLVKRDPGFGTDILFSGILDFIDAHALFTVSTQTSRAQALGVYGSNGSMIIPIAINIFSDVPATMMVTTDMGTREIQLGSVDQFGLEFEEFSRAIRGERSVPIPPEDTINNLKVLDKLFESEESGEWEEV